MVTEGFSIEGARKHVDDFEAGLEKLVVNPRKERILPIDREYTPVELRDMLQRFGSSLAILSSMEGKIESECHLLKEGLKTSTAITVVKEKPKTGSVSGDEAFVLEGSEALRHIRKLQIYNESVLLALKGWRRAYDDAYVSVSRMISIQIGELTLQTGRST